MKTYIPVAIQRRVRERFRNCCAYCRSAESLTATTFEFEHIAPRSAGGETVFENLCLACPTCNRCKADSVHGTDPATQTVVPLFHPQNHTWREHFAWTDSGAEITGLTAIGRATIVALKMNRAAVVRVRRMWFAMGEHPPAD